MIARSASATTSTGAVAVLFAWSSPLVVVSTVAELVKVVGASTEASTTALTTIVEVPGRRAAREQVMTWPAGGRQDHWPASGPLPAALTGTSPAGIVSVTTTWSAVDGPWFSTVRVNSVPAGSPATTGSAPVVALVSTSSASSITLVSAESLLLAPAFGGSGVVSESTRAVLRRVVGPADGSTSTTISIRSPSPSSPAARTVARVHSTVPLPGTSHRRSTDHRRPEGTARTWCPVAGRR